MNLQHIQTLPSQINSFISTIKHLSAAQRDNIMSLTFLDVSCQNIASQTCIGKSTVARDLQEIKPNEENHHGGHSSKLSPTSLLRMVIALCGLSVSATLWRLVVMYSCY
jgi:hypothetical protein